MIAAEIQLSFYPVLLPHEMPVVNSSWLAFSLFKKHWEEGKIHLQAQFKVMLLNADDRVLGIYECSNGGMMSTVADVRLVFVAALKATATRIIVCHNNPSVTLKPSVDDKLLTAKLSSAGRVLDIKVADFLVITNRWYFSYGDQGLL